MGVRWIWPGESGEVIPKTKTISVNGLDVKFMQPLQSSRIHPSNVAQAGWQSEKAWKDYTAADFKWFDRMGFSWDSSIRAQHSYGHPGWQYGHKYFKDHPDWFNLLPDGTRRPNPYYVVVDVEYMSICPNSDGLLQQVIKDWREKGPKGYPFGPNVFVGENDTPGSCCCEACLADDLSHDPGRLKRARAKFAKGDRTWPDELGSVTERYAKYYMKALREAKEHDPKVKVIAQTYSNYTEPPKTKLDKDIIICATLPLHYPWTQKKIDEFYRCWKGWANSGCTMVLRPNFMLDGHCMPINFSRKFYDLYKMCLETGMIGTEYDSDIGQFGGNGINYYVMARTTMRPDLTYGQIFDEYCSAFGKAAPEIKNYWNYWEKISDSKLTTEADKKAVYNPVGAEPGSWNYFYLIAPLIYMPEVIAEGRAYLDRAEALVKDDPEALRRVQFLQKGLKNAGLTCEAQNAFASKDKMVFAAAVNRLDKFRAEIEPDFVANMHHLFNWENVSWDRTSLNFLMTAPGMQFKSPWEFSFDPDNSGMRKGYFKADFDDSKWADIGIDTGWEKQKVGEAWKAEHGSGYDGYAWYRNTFTLDPKDKDGSCTLTFGAVDESCEVYVNGKLVLSRPYPYKGDSNSWMTPFTVDVTKAVSWDRPNSLAVRVHDQTQQGGIWKTVWSKSKPPKSTKPNIVKNGDFEIPHVWGEHGVYGKTALKYQATPAHSGRYSGVLSITELDPKGRNLYEKGWIRWFQEVTVQPGRAYEFSAWYRTAGNYGGSVRIWVYGEGVRYESVTGDSGGRWLEVSADIKTTDKTTKLTIYLNVCGNVGKVFFDDVELREKSPERGLAWEETGVPGSR